MFSTARSLELDSSSASSSSAEPMAVEPSSNDAYEELIRSIPIENRRSIVAELDSIEITRRAALLCEQLASNEMVSLNLEESRSLFLAALRNVRDKKIPVAQLATLHILDSAIRTLYTNPMNYMIHKYVGSDGVLQRTFNVFNMDNLTGMPTSVKRYSYNTIVLPKAEMSISELPQRMQKPLMQRFFNFNDSEWDDFCLKMVQIQSSERFFHILTAPDEGCWSSIIFRIQKVLKCMRVVDWLVETKTGFETESIMLVPSFTIFQTAINVKAHTLGRKPVELVPTYGYIKAEHYAALKFLGKIAMAMYLPEKSPYVSYKNNTGSFRTSIDGHPSETAFAGAIHDVYHAMREMMMSENVAKARMRLASIAKTHPNNKLNVNTRAVDEILIDGELIYSYSLALDTMFDPEYRSNEAQSFGDLFYASVLVYALHGDLKRAFIEDMVVNEELWQREYNINKSDLRSQDQVIFDEIKAQQLKQAEEQSGIVIPFSAAQAIQRLGVLGSGLMDVEMSASSSSLPSQARSAPRPGCSVEKEKVD